MQGQQAAETPPRGAPSRTQSQSRQAASPQPMTPEAAQEMLETLREKSESAQSLRQAQQRARMRAAGVDKTW